jgi:hypothetical protein
VKQFTNSTPKRAITRNRDWGQPFLLELAATGNVSAACSEACIDRVTAYNRRRDDPVFRQRWQDALNQAADLLELEARRRAEKGVDEPVIYQGTIAGQWLNEDGVVCKHDDPGAKFIPITIKKYSDTLLIFLLKGIRPKKYRETLSVKHSGKIKHKHGATKSLLAKIKGDEKAAEALSVLASRMKQPNVN